MCASRGSFAVGCGAWRRRRRSRLRIIGRGRSPWGSIRAAAYWCSRWCRAATGSSCRRRRRGCRFGASAGRPVCGRSGCCSRLRTQRRSAAPHSCPVSRVDLLDDRGAGRVGDATLARGPSPPRVEAPADHAEPLAHELDREVGLLRTQPAKPGLLISRQDTALAVIDLRLDDAVRGRLRRRLELTSKLRRRPALLTDQPNLLGRIRRTSASFHG